MAKHFSPPVLTVPTEIFLAIASFLTTGQLLRLTRATKILRAVVFDAGPLWEDLDLKGMTRLTDENVRILLRNLTPVTRHCIQLIDVSDTGPYLTSHVFEPILRACPNLRTFNFRNRSDASLPTIAAELLRLTTLPDPPHLPNLQKFNLLEDRRLAQYIVRYDEGILKTVRQAVAALASPIHMQKRCADTGCCPDASSQTHTHATPQTDLYQCDNCPRHLAALTTPCADCGSHPRPNLCIVCQSFCDRCFRQYCFQCFGRHCDLVACHCPLTEFRNVLCYCTECRPEFECPSCHNVYCQEHLVRCQFDDQVLSCKRGCLDREGGTEGVTVCGVEGCWNAVHKGGACEDRAKGEGWRDCGWCGVLMCGGCAGGAGNEYCYMCPEREFVLLFGREDPWESVEVEAGRS